MATNLHEWLVLLTRWLHIITAISWIGSSFFFNWLDRRLRPKGDSGDDNQIGQLWMVHGGGFYSVEKMPFGLKAVPDVLHWFKWEAAMTWLSGALLLGLVYYGGGGSLLIDPDIARLSYGQALAISIGAIVISSALYDILWESKLARKPGLAHGLTIALACGVAYGLCITLSGRAAYMHMGAVLGTWMVANVWQRIIPGQAKSLDAVKAGKPVNPAWSASGKARSVHNNYFTLPVIFIMMSNHFPSTYGHDLNWLLLIVIGLVGAAIRHYFNLRADRPKSAKMSLLPAVAGLILLVLMTGEPGDGSVATDRVASKGVERSAVPDPVDPETAGSISGTVFFDGPSKSRKKLRMAPECSHMHGEPVLQQSLVVNDGRLQNAFVWIAEGLEDLTFPVPTEEVLIDQIGCIYVPHMNGAQVGQKVTFINSDPVLHNVKSTSKINRKFNKAMPKQHSRMTQVFKRTEIAVPVKCSLHPWMGAYIGVVPHPYFAVTDEKGSFRLERVPAGNYVLGVWHKHTGEQRIDVQVDAKGEATAEFRVSPQ